MLRGREICGVAILHFSATVDIPLKFPKPNTQREDSIPLRYLPEINRIEPFYLAGGTPIRE